MNRVAIYLISDGIGGAEQVVVQIMSGLRKNNSIYLIVNNEIAHFYINLLPDNRVLNIGDIFLHSKKKYKRIRFLLHNRFFSFIPWLIRSKSRIIFPYLIDNKITIIHTHLDYALYSSLDIKRKFLDVLVFNTVHGAFGLVEDKLLKPSMRISRNDFKDVDKLIFVSYYMYNLYKIKGIPVNEFEIIYNGIKNDIKKKYSRSVKTNSEFQILYVGGSKYVKGYDILIETVELLSKSIMQNNFKVIVLGSLNDNSEFVKMIRQRGLENFFSLVGFVAPPLNLNYFKSADILFMPSRSEALPIAALEAVFYDLPIVASNVGGLPEVIKDGYNGLLAIPDAGEFVNSITEIFANYSKYNSLTKEINVELRKKFNAVTMCSRYMALYETSDKL